MKITPKGPRIKMKKFIDDISFIKTMNIFNECNKHKTLTK